MKTKKYACIILVSCVFPSFSRSACSAEVVFVPMGAFSMGCSVNNPDCDKGEGPVGGAEVYIPAFSIGVYKIYVADYRRCIEAGKCSRPAK